MNKRLFLGGAILWLIAACAPNEEVPPPPTTITAEETAIAKKLIQGAFDDLWGGLDSTKLLDYHTADFYILEHGEIWTNDEIKAYMRGTLKQEDRPERINEMSYHTIEKLGGVINIAYHNYATFMQGDSMVGKAQWLESAVAIPTDDGWRLRMMHSTWMPYRATEE